MIASQTTLERTFELAASGKFLKVGELINAIQSEGYDVHQLEGRYLRKQLQALMVEARYSPDANSN